MNRSLLALLSVPLLLGLGACGVPEVEGEPGALSQAVSDPTWDLDENGVEVVRTWDSGKTTNLSSLLSISCTSLGTEMLLVKLSASREPAANLDDFIARLRGTCRKFGTQSAPTWPYSSPLPLVETDDLIYTAPHTPGPLHTEVPVGGSGNNIPTGIRLTVNNGEYVKDVELFSRVVTNVGLGAAKQYQGPATGLSGTLVTHDCPTDYALTGVKLKVSTDTGKIRFFQTVCKKLVLR